MHRVWYYLIYICSISLSFNVHGADIPPDKKFRTSQNLISPVHRHHNHGKQRSELSDLHRAALYNDTQAVQKHIDNGHNVDEQCNLEQVTPLHTAASMNHTAIIKVLLDNGAHINAMNRDKETPLHVAATNRYGNVVFYLLHRGANAAQADGRGRVPIHTSVELHDVISIKHFLKANLYTATLRHKKLGWTPLHEAACQRGHVLPIHLFLAHGVSPDVRDIYGNTPLHHTASKEMTEHILQYGGDECVYNNENETPLQDHIRSEKMLTVKVLLAYGAARNLYVHIPRNNKLLTLLRGQLAIAGLRTQEDIDVWHPKADQRKGEELAEDAAIYALTHVHHHGINGIDRYLNLPDHVSRSQIYQSIFLHSLGVYAHASHAMERQGDDARLREKKDVSLSLLAEVEKQISRQDCMQYIYDNIIRCRVFPPVVKSLTYLYEQDVLTFCDTCTQDTLLHAIAKSFACLKNTPRNRKFLAYGEALAYMVTRFQLQMSLHTTLNSAGQTPIDCLLQVSQGGDIQEKHLDSFYVPYLQGFGEVQRINLYNTTYPADILCVCQQ